MPFGQSTFVASPLSLAAGTVVGHYVEKIAEERGASKLMQKLATGAAHYAASSLTGYAVNAALGADVTGATVTTVQSPTTAIMHGMRSGRKPLPVAFQSFE